MRKRIPKNKHPYVSAIPGQKIVRIGNHFSLFYRVRKCFRSNDQEDIAIINKIPRIIFTKYTNTIFEFRKEIDSIMSSYYPGFHYPDSAISEIMIVIKSMREYPSDVIAKEICEKF